MKRRASVPLVVLGMFSACASNPELAGALPTPDGEQFVHEVYPLLLRDCAF
ncbi:MAG: hypothetical protein RL701_2205, partial [Pseudomonadota bacterium]